MLSHIFRYSSRNTKRQLNSVNQIAEWFKPTDIITHCPTLADRFPFHLDAFLYESPPSPDQAAQCHNQFCKLLEKESGARIWTVREILKQMTPERLRTLVIDSSKIRFDISPSVKISQFSEKMQREYFYFSLSNLSKENLIDLLMLNPEVTISVDSSSTGFSCTSIPVSPLANLLFTRDQQIVTSKGLVMGSFSTPQRSSETKMMKVIWSQLRVPVIGSIHPPWCLEGGDFIPLGKDLAIFGTGIRTSNHAVYQLMKEDLIGTNRVVIVEDRYDNSQERSHLDTYFAALDEKVAVIVDAIARDAPSYLRIAHEYVKKDGKYQLESQSPFGAWLKKEGYNLINVTLDQQKDGIIDFIHLGKDSHGVPKILSIDSELEDVLKFAGVKTNVVYMDLSPITSMHGGAHVATQVFRANK